MIQPVLDAWHDARPTDFLNYATGSDKHALDVLGQMLGGQGGAPDVLDVFAQP